MIGRFLALRAATFLVIACAVGCNSDLPSQSGQSTEPRIVVIAPALAEMVAALGMAGNVIGIGQFGPWPEGMADLPVVGGYDQPSLESVLGLGATVFINTASQAAAPSHQQLQSLGVEVMALDTSTQASIFEALSALGQRFDRMGRAQQLIAQIEEQLAQVEMVAHDLPPRSVLLVVGRDPLYVAGPGSHLDYLLTMAGGENVAADADAPYVQLSMEAALERRPEVIIDLAGGAVDRTAGRAAGPWADWDFIPAVTNDQVHFVDPSQLAIPGMRLGEMALRLGRMIHPEAFGQPVPADYQIRRQIQGQIQGQRDGEVHDAATP